METQQHARTSAASAARVALVLAVVFLLFVSYGLIDNRWYHIVTINGGSMEPTISNGDAIVIVRPPDRLEPGMVVTLQVGENVVTHRVKTVASDGTFTTAGDANPSSDDWTGVSVKVVGVCVGRIPLLGRLLDGLSDAVRSGAYYTSRKVTGAALTVTGDLVSGVVPEEGSPMQSAEPLPPSDSDGAMGALPPTETDESAAPVPPDAADESSVETSATEP